MASTECRAVRDFLRQRLEADRAAPFEPNSRRRQLDDISNFFPLPDDVSTRTVTAGRVPTVRLHHVDDQRTLGDTTVVLYLHGGGYHRGSATSHQELAWRIAAEVGAQVLLPEYRLAPEHPFPAALADALATFRWLVTNQGVAPEHIALVGDSAGGGLALSAMIMLRRLGEPMPACAVLLSPWADLRVDLVAQRFAAASDIILTELEFRTASDWYLAGRYNDLPLVSPLLGDLTGLPPLLIQVGSDEVLLGDSTGLAATAKKYGVATKLHVYQDMFHVWQIMANLPEAQAAIGEIGQFLTNNVDPVECPLPV